MSTIEFEFEGASWRVAVEPANHAFELTLKGPRTRMGRWSAESWSIEWDAEVTDDFTRALLEHLEESLDQIMLDVVVLKAARPAAEANDEAADAAEVGHVGGRPLGVSTDDWPRFQDVPMQHLVTVPKAAIPAELGAATDVVAVALFCYQPNLNEAFTPDTDQSAVLFLTAADLSRGESAPPDGYLDDEELARAALTYHPSQISMAELRSISFAGGSPIWIQGAESKPDFGAFLFQFDEELVPMNLGDAGVMYVFENAAWWQCY